MPNPSEIALAAIGFGVRRTEAVVRGVAHLGFSVTRNVLGAALRTVTGSGSPQAPARDRAVREDEYGSPPDWPPEPSPPEPSAPRDPERQRRIELRDQPTERGEPHHVLNNPVSDEPDPTEWPDPYDRREDPRDPAPDQAVAGGEAPHTPTGSQSTSAPHPSQDPEAER